MLDYGNHWQIRQNCRCGAGWRCLKMRFLVFLVDPLYHFSGLSPSCTCFDFCLTCSSGHPGPCVWILSQCCTILMIYFHLPFYLSTSCLSKIEFYVTRFPCLSPSPKNLECVRLWEVLGSWRSLTKDHRPCIQLARAFIIPACGGRPPYTEARWRQP